MRLGIVTGGHGPERAGALLSGKHVQEACISLGINHKILDAADLNFHELRQVECVFLTTHGWYGEDGKLQGTLDMLRIPYSGSGVAASAAAYFKPFANAIATSIGLRTPRSQVVDLRSPEAVSPHCLHKLLGSRVFVKPASNGCSQGAKILNSADDVKDWMKSSAHGECPVFLAAQYVRGKDISVGIIEIDHKPVALPLLETRHGDHFYSFEVKSGKIPRNYVCPAEISRSTEKTLKDQALKIYQALGCRGFARVDFILSEEDPWFLEVNTIPGLSKEGNFSQMSYAFGWNYEELIYRLISTIDKSISYRP